MKLTVALSVASLLSISAFAGNEIKLNYGTINTDKQKFLAAQAAAEQTEWIIQFKGHVTELVKSELRTAGIAVYSYIPEDALLVRASKAQMDAWSKLTTVQAVLPFTAAMKMSPTLGPVSSVTAQNRQTFLVSVFEKAERASIEAAIKNLAKDVIVEHSAGNNFVVTTSRGLLVNMAAIAGAENIQAVAEVHPLHIDLGETGLATEAAGDYSDINGFETGTKVMNFDTA